MATGTSRTWALVMNGTRARILRGICSIDDKGPIELVMKSEARNLRDILSEKQQPAFAAKTAGRRPLVQTASDPIAEDQREFIRQVIALLESHRRAGEFDRLAVFAGSDVLGNLHNLMPRSLHDMLQCEVSTNLLHLPEKELCRVITRELKNGRNDS